jgi:hypothetical protein
MIVKTTIPKSNIIKPISHGLELQYKSFLKKKNKESVYYFIKYNKLYINNTLRKKITLEELEFLAYKRDLLVQASKTATGIRQTSASTYHKVCRKIKVYEATLSNIPETNQVYIDFPTFKKILKLHNEKVQDYLLEGYRFKLGTNIGFLEMRTIERNFNKKRIDHGETNKEKKRLLSLGYTLEDLKNANNPSGKMNYIRYFEEDVFAMLAFKSAAKLKNSSVYKFIPAAGQVGKGFKNKIQREVKSKPHLLNLYPLFTKKLN